MCPRKDAQIVPPLSPGLRQPPVAAPVLALLRAATKMITGALPDERERERREEKERKKKSHLDLTLSKDGSDDEKKNLKTISSGRRRSRVYTDQSGER